MLQSLGAGLAQGVPNFLAQALPMVLQFTETLRTNFGNIVDAGIDLLLNLAQGIANGLPTLIEYVPQIVTNIAGLINDNAPKLLAAGLHIIVTLGLGLIQAIPTLIANIPQIIQAVVSVFTAFNWISLGSNIITMLKTASQAWSVPYNPQEHLYSMPLKCNCKPARDAAKPGQQCHHKHGKRP